jgi:hypothetical protein
MIDIGSEAASGYDLRISIPDNVASFYRDNKDGNASVTIVSHTLHTVPIGHDLTYYQTLSSLHDSSSHHSTSTSTSVATLSTSSSQSSTSTTTISSSSSSTTVTMSGINNVLPTITKLMSHTRTRAAIMRDHHPYWAKHAESAAAGKLLVLDHPISASGEKSCVHQVPHMSILIAFVENL